MVALLGAVLLVLVAGCSSGPEASDRCVAGEAQPCTLADGRGGTRMCGADFRWSDECFEQVDGGVVGVAPPDIPWLADSVPPLRFAPCPTGWREVMDDFGFLSCEPPTEAPPCPDGQVQLVGEEGCATVGPACPADGRVADLPADRTVVHVLAGAAGGDGSRTAPYGSLQEFAWGRLSGGTVVAVDRGTYEGEVRLPSRVSLWGACVTETVLTSAAPHAVDGVVTAVASDAEIRGVGIGPSARPGVRVSGPGNSVALEGVWIEGAQVQGVAVAEAAELRATDLVVVGTRPGSGSVNGGQGLSVQRGARAEVTRAVFARNQGLGILSRFEGATVVLSDVAIRDTQHIPADLTYGRGLQLDEGGVAELSRVVVERSREVGIYVAGSETSIIISESIVRETAGRESDGVGGWGFDLRLGALATMDRVSFVQNEEFGIALFGDGTALDGADVIVRDTASRASDGILGRGLNLENGASAEVVRAVLVRNHGAGVSLGEGTSATLSALLIRDTRGWEGDRTYGRGVDLRAAMAAISEAVVQGNREIGLGSHEGSSLSLEDVVVRDTTGRDNDGVGGRGLYAASGSTVQGTRLVLERNRDVSAFASGEGATLFFSDVVIDDTLAQQCSLDGRCAATPFGIGLGAYRGAQARAVRFAIRRADLCGLQLTTEAGVDLAEGVVAECAIGACVQVDGYDLSRLTASVRYEANGTPLEATTLPVPEASPPSLGAGGT